MLRHKDQDNPVDHVNKQITVKLFHKLVFLNKIKKTPATTIMV